MVPDGDVEAPVEGAGGKKKRPRSRRVSVWMTDEEYALIKAKAEDAGLSLSGYFKAAGFRRKLVPLSDTKAISDILKVSGDIGRFGGLIKLWLSDKKQKDVSREDLQRILDEARELIANLRISAGKIVP